MKKINVAYFLTALICALAMLFPAYSSTGHGLSKSLHRVASIDTVCNVWVFFNDRPVRGGREAVSERALQRRQRARFVGDAGDLPVHRSYINEIQRRGGRLRHEFPWGNAASFSVRSSQLEDIASLPFVRSVEPVAVYVNARPDRGSGLYKASSVLPATFRALGYEWHTEMVNIPMAHEYIKMRGLGNPGRGVFLAFFDSGFRLDHHALIHVKDSARVVSVYDFVDGDTLVHDADSILADDKHPYHGSDRHGTQTLALVSGYHPGHYIGGAWGARVALARTEDIVIEARVEEDNWAAAVVWAEKLGADIISSSLGYRDSFDDTTENYRPADMDGKTTIVSIAAAGAVERGMIVVNSAGNESRGSNPRQTLTAPADVGGVTAVGAVDRSRIITDFSSVGPTADGRLKPDVVAPGRHVPVLDVYSGAYIVSNGTSFSAPIVSAIFALILQAHPGITAEEARARLYASCEFAPRQTNRDNIYGHGIPNALRAIMRDDEAFIRITDMAGVPLPGALVKTVDSVYTAGESGCVLIKAAPGQPLDMKIYYRGDSLHAFTADSLPFEATIDVEVKRADGMKVLPSVVKRNNAVRGKYYFNGADVSTPAVAMVHTLDGRKVWQETIRLRPDGSAEFVWNGSKRAAAGIYLITVRHGGNQVSNRIIISN